MSSGDYFGKVIVENFPYLLEGMFLTVQIIGLGLVFSMVTGLLVALMRVAPLRPLRIIGAVYVDLFRNVPPLIWLFFAYFGLPSIGVKLPGLWCGVLGVGTYLATYAAEAMRSGIQSVDVQQLVAAQSLGMSYRAAMRYVILPQAILAAFPALINVFISIVKGSLFLSIIGVEEFFFRIEHLESLTWRTWELFAFAAVGYLTIVIPLTRMARKAEAALEVRRK
jgi:putative glutamine transport system permease protein